ncbi:MAG: hypothetical protein ACRDLE_01920 [Gaiellaceae bacterium]
MAGVALRTAVALATGLTAAAAAGSARSTSHSAHISAFGGPTAVHIAHVGRIDVDLGASTPVGLRRVRCSGVPAESMTCFVGR